MTAFAATFVPARLIAQTQTEWLGDSAVEVLKGIVSTVEFYESKSDAELGSWIASHERSRRILAEDRDWDEAENHSYEADICRAVIENRAILARYTNPVALTYTLGDVA
jgi:hypothetical protein